MCIRDRDDIRQAERDVRDDERRHAEAFAAEQADCRDEQKHHGNTGDDFRAVSYTHLDVYKRQAHQRADRLAAADIFV